MTRPQIFSAFLLVTTTSLHASAFTIPTGVRVGLTASSKQSLPQGMMSRLQMSQLDTETENSTDQKQQPKNPLGKDTYLSSLEAADKTAVAIPASDDETTEELSETQKLMAKVKESGTAGVVSYAIWELAFWFISIPVCILGYQKVTGHWPDLSNSDDQAKLGAEAFAFVNFARFAVPLRIGLALSTTPWIQDNIVDRFMKKDESMEEPLMNEESTFNSEQK